MRPVLLLLCCLFSTLLGMLYASRLKSRIRELKGLERMAMLIRQEIAYGRQPLPDIFERLGRRMEQPRADFLHALGRELKEHGDTGFSEIFSRQTDACLGTGSLRQEDLDSLKEMGAYLGYLDRDTQLHTLDMYLRDTEKRIRELSEQYPEKSRVCRTLGAMGGIFLAVLLF
ncbi:MAG TPA: hypothetical protein DF613_02840 [Lachnospiraceae bacterium]|nr:hypothetical protein [Lachnospiraceae bacterium]